MNNLIVYALIVLKSTLPIFICFGSFRICKKIIMGSFSLSCDIDDSENNINDDIIEDSIGICFIDYNDHDFIDIVKGE